MLWKRNARKERGRGWRRKQAIGALVQAVAAEALAWRSIRVYLPICKYACLLVRSELALFIELARGWAGNLADPLTRSLDLLVSKLPRRIAFSQIQQISNKQARVREDEFHFRQGGSRQFLLSQVLKEGRANVHCIDSMLDCWPTDHDPLSIKEFDRHMLVEVFTERVKLFQAGDGADNHLPLLNGDLAPWPEQRDERVHIGSRQRIFYLKHRLGPPFGAVWSIVQNQAAVSNCAATPPPDGPAGSRGYRHPAAPGRSGWKPGVQTARSRQSSGLQSLDDGGDALADADAHRRQPQAGLAPLHLLEQGRQDARPGAAQRMAQGNRAAVDVGALVVQPQRAHALKRLDGERLVEFDQIKVAGAQS